MRERPPDVSIGARVKAKRVRFDEVPPTRVGFRGSPGVDTASGSLRKGLPDDGVEAGVEYRDVEVEWGASARLRCHRPDGDEVRDEHQRDEHGRDSG